MPQKIVFICSYNVQQHSPLEFILIPGTINSPQSPQYTPNIPQYTPTPIHNKILHFIDHLSSHHIFTIISLIISHSDESPLEPMTRIHHYMLILSQLETGSITELTSQQLYNSFSASVNSYFKLNIIIDNSVIDALLYRLQTHYADHLINPDSTFINLIIFTKRTIKLLYDNHFITKRGQLRAKLALIPYESDKHYKLYEAMKYLRKSETKLEFRIDFLTHLLNHELDPDNESDQEFLSDEHMSTIYTSFWSEALITPNNIKELNYLESVFIRHEDKYKMLPITLVQQIDAKLEKNVGENQNEMEINNLLIECAESNAHQKQSESYMRLETEVKVLERMLKNFSGLKIFTQNGEDNLQLRVAKFGSLVSGFACHDADLDVTILSDCYIDEQAFLQLLYRFLKSEYEQSDTSRLKHTTVTLVCNAKTPLIKLAISEHRSERNRNETIKIDLLVNNILGVINSRFLCVYSQVNWLRNLGLLVKIWGKHRKLIDQNYFSSYSIVLMLIHYLIEERIIEPILDNRDQQLVLQRPSFHYKRIKQGEIEEFIVHYPFKTDPKDVTSTRRINYLEILQGFMKYYAEDILKKDQHIVSVDGTQDKIFEQDYIYTIKDPFDKTHNPARVKNVEQRKILEIFATGFKELKSKDSKIISRMFAMS